MVSLKEKVAEIDEKMTAQDFWDDHEKAQEIMKEFKVVKDKIESFESLHNQWEELTLLAEMAVEEDDDSLEKEIQKEMLQLTKSLGKLRLKTLLSDKYDINSAILSIHSGAGGLDAQDWAEILLRMFTRWAEKQGYAMETLDYIPDKEGGIKSVTLRIKGDYAYGYLKSEKGVHRLVRMSPFDTSGKRHTSFTSVDVMPELPDDVAIDINPVDLRTDTYRSSGAGGQHVNKTDSAIRITHLPTGIVVQCQNERSQLHNKNTAMRMLMAKLIELQKTEHKEKIEDIQGDYSQIAWGSQIRTYVFHPYTMVKDHRTGAEVGNIASVLDGDIDIFINAYLQQNN